MRGASLASIEDILGRIDNLLRIVDEVPGSELLASKAGSEIVESAYRALKAEQERAEHFGTHMFANPGWVILLQLFVSTGEGHAVDTDALCAAASVPETVALRHLAALVAAKLVRRQPHSSDPAVTYLTLTPAGERALCDYFSRIPRERDAAAA